jgi:hypothetical protein
MQVIRSCFHIIYQSHWPLFSALQTIMHCQSFNPTLQNPMYCAPQVQYGKLIAVQAAAVCSHVNIHGTLMVAGVYLKVHEAPRQVQ